MQELQVCGSKAVCLHACSSAYKCGYSVVMWVLKFGSAHVCLCLEVGAHVCAFGGVFVYGVCGLEEENKNIYGVVMRAVLC